MTHIKTSLLVLATVLGASAALAADQDQLRLKDGSCLDPMADGTTADCLYMADQDRVMLKDGSCLLEDGSLDETCDQLQLQTRTRTRTGAENGAGDVHRTRSEGGNSSSNGGRK